MQIMIDTAIDTAADIYWLADLLSRRYATAAPTESVDANKYTLDPQFVTRVTSSEAESGPDVIGGGMPPIPAPPAVPVTEWGDAELEIEKDEGGTVTSLTSSVPLPPGIPAPPADIRDAPPPPVPPAPGGVVELDKRGMPWDGRIHAANRARKLDGSWKNKRGVSPDLVTACEAQNRPLDPTGNPSSAAPTAISGVPPVASAPVAAPPPPPVPAAPPAPATAPPPPVPSAGNAAPAVAVGFREVMAKIGKLNHEQVVALLAPFGLKPEDMLDLVGNLALIASVNAAVDKMTV